MSLRPKTKRRLLVLLAGAAIVTGATTVVVKVQLHRHEAVRLEYRAKAMDAFARGDYPAALDNFKRYLSSDSQDVEAIYAYGVARARVPRPDYANLSEAKSIFGHYLELQPGDVRAQHQLLDIYQKLNYDAEALTLAESILSKDPNDVPALRAKTRSLIRQSKYDDAIAVSTRVNELAPESLQDQKTTYVLMKQLKRPPAEITGRAQEMLNAHPDNPRFELLRAFAASIAGDNEGARKWVLTAATRTPPDADFVRELAGVLDRLGMFDQSRALIEKAALDPKTSPELTAVLARRLIENGQYADALDKLNAIDPADPNADARLLGLRALAIYSLSEQSTPTTRPASRAQADGIVDALGQRTADGVASAWASLLKARFTNPPLDPREAAKLYQAALLRDPDNAAAHYFLGLSYRELGETELAMQNWKQASQLSPAWIDPHIMTARQLLADGRVEDAFTEARIAAARAPGSLAAQTTLAVVAYNQLDTGSAPANSTASQVDQVMALASDIQARVPNEPQTLPVYVALLARTGHRDDAAAAIRAALGAKPPLPSETLLKLAQASALLQLGLEQSIADHLTAAPATTPDAAFDAAAVLATAGRPLDGLTSVTAARDANHGADKPEWQLAVARYREAIGDPGVADTWTQLADANPQNLEIQRAVLQSTSAWSNRTLIDHCIENLKALTPPDSLDWRMARARWKLSSPDNVRDNANAAASMMADVARAAPNLTEPLVIWADALEKLGDLAGATDRLRSAVAQSRGDLNVSMRLAQLLQRQGKGLDAREVLEQVTQSPAVTPAGRVQIARMLSSQGDYELATKVLQQAGSPDTVNVDRDLLLAQLMQSRGKIDEAAHLYDAALNAPNANENVVRTVAAFYARRGDTAEAQAALQRLDAIKLAPGAKELALATFEEQFGNPATAQAQYEAGTRAAPSKPATWRGLAGFFLRHGNCDAAASLADQGAKATNNNAELIALANGARTFAAIKPGADLQSVAVAFSLNPTEDGPAQTLAALAKSNAVHETPDQTLARLRTVAEQNPRFLPVQVLLTQRYFAAGRYRDADDVASRAMSAMPTEAEAARVLSVVAAAAGQWDRALTAAVEWRNRTLDQPLAADLQIADARVHLNDPEGAIRQLSPYIDQAKAKPDATPQILRLYARALAQDARASEAQALLEPLLKDSPAWRMTSLDIASSATRNLEVATAWIDRVAPLVNTDSRDEQLRLAAAWATVGQRFADSTALTKARDLLQPLTADGANPTLAVWLSLGSVAQELNDLPTADNAYRRALQLDPQQASARNNLAYVILLRGGDLKEATTLATQAVAAAPNNSAYQDTLARVYARNGNLEAALTAFQNALHADAGNVEAMIGLADTQARAGQRDRATTTLQQIDALLRSNPPIPQQVRQQLDELRVTLKKSTETTSVTDVK